MNVSRQSRTSPIILSLVMFAWAAALLAAGSPSIRDAAIEKEFQPVLIQLPVIMDSGGAAVVDTSSGRYFVAVGMTEVRDDSSQDKLRQLRVSKVQAQKAAIAFTEETKVVAEEKLIERTTVVNKDGKKSAEVLKTLDETTATAVKGMLKSLPQVGTWKSADGKLFFCAVGKRLADEGKHE